MAYFAYIHCKPDGVPFYVGKGTRSRHTNFRDRNVYHKRIVAKYGQKNVLVGRLDCTTNDIALALEVGLIKCLRRMGVPLANLTEGGQGTVGWRCPESVRSAVAKANRRRVHSAAQRLAAGKAWRGKKRPEHSALLRARGSWAGKANPWFGAGARQLGEKNHAAKAVVGVHPQHGSSRWPTLQATADTLGVTIQAVAQALKKGHRSRGWFLRCADDV